MAIENKKKVSEMTGKKRGRGRPRKDDLVMAVEEPKQLVLWEDDVKDLPQIKDDMSTMQYPFFSISNRIDTAIRTYQNGNDILRVYPSSVGCPTQSDKDVLIFLASILARANFKNREDYLIKRRIKLKVADFARVTQKTLSGMTPKILLQSLRRLAGVRLETNIRNDMSEESHGFSYIDEYKITESNKSQDGVIECEVVLSEWFAQHLVDYNFLTITDKYFSLTPTEKRLYEVVRKFCGSQPMFKISIQSLASRMIGEFDTKNIRFFRRTIRKIVHKGKIPDYILYFDAQADQLVCFKGPFEEAYAYVRQSEKMFEWFCTLEHQDFDVLDTIDVSANEKEEVTEDRKENEKRKR